MADRINVEVNRHTPTLDHYRRQWRPRPGTDLGGIWLGAVVSDASGRKYWAVRGTDDMITGMTHMVSPVCGFRSLPETLDEPAPHLYDEYSTIDWFEPLQYSDSGDSVRLTYSSGYFQRASGGFEWSDASGRWKLAGKTVSDIVVTCVPRQAGIPEDAYYRHELMYVTGTINGIAVSGYGHQDFAYGPPGFAYTELPIARDLQGMWVSYLHEYGDGTLGGGSFWQGRDERPFGPGYSFEDGVTTTHDDIVATPGFTPEGKQSTLEAHLGPDTYSFTFNAQGSPLHYFGTLDKAPSGKGLSRSWCWIEYAGGMLTPEILDLIMQQYRLARGR